MLSAALRIHLLMLLIISGAVSTMVGPAPVSGTMASQQPHQRPHNSSTTETSHNHPMQPLDLSSSTSTTTSLGTEFEHKNDWITANHDIFGTRSSNQTIIGKNNVNKLRVKWILPNEFVIEDPPVIVAHRGFVQDNGGNIIAFDTRTGNVHWKIHPGIGGKMHGLTYDHDILFSGTGYNATTVAISAINGRILWQSPILGPSQEGYNVNTPPIVWKNYVIVGSAGGDMPPGKGVVQGNITALNRTNGRLIWNFQTTTGQWVHHSKSPPNGGATAWSGGSLDPQSGILYMPLGNPTPNYNASTRLLTPELYSNHMIALNITNGKLVWATSFIAQGTVLKLRVPDTHDWDTSWGSSVTRVRYENGTYPKIVIGHDKMGNIIAMNAATGKEIWWRTMGKEKDYNTDTIPQPKGSGLVWTYGIDTYHAVDNNNTLYVTTNGRALNFFTNGTSGYRTPIAKSIELGYVNGTITAIDMRTGVIKWNDKVNFPPLVSPTVSQGLVFSGYIPFVEKSTTSSEHGHENGHTRPTHQIRTGLILALDSSTGKEMWRSTVPGPIGAGGPSIGDGMLFVPTGKIQSFKGILGSIVAFGLPSMNEVKRKYDCVPPLSIFSMCSLVRG